MKSAAATYAADSGRREGLMASIETQVREFATQFPTPNVLRAVALCEDGTLAWAQVAAIFRDSLAAGLESVA